jgi:hypothetical protein
MTSLRSASLVNAPSQGVRIPARAIGSFAPAPIKTRVSVADVTPAADALTRMTTTISSLVPE